MLGTNPTAAKFSGIDTKSITMKVYILSGILGAIAGIIVMSRTNSVAYEYGTRTYILQALLISVLGGISGFGSVIGVLLATFILQVISTGFNMLLLGVQGSFFSRIFLGSYFHRDSII
jgi:simple sugar transport system permease protein